MRKNGLTWPLSPAQFGSWLFLLTDIGFTCAIAIEFDSVFVLMTYAASTVVLIIVGFVTTVSNPVSSPQLAEVSEAADKLYYCTICMFFVTKSTKHCSTCGRCVDGFDHHCKWINNCVSSKNYKLFITLIVCVEAKAAVTIALYSLIVASADETLLFSAAALMLSAYSLVVVATSWLILMHIYFKCRGLTTYEYIKLRRTQKVRCADVPVPTEGEQVGNMTSRGVACSAISAQHEDNSDKY